MRGVAATTAFLVALAGVTVSACSQQGDQARKGEQTAAAACDRDCILKVTDSYLSAIAARDPQAAPLADNVVFVENLKRMKPGEGLWQTATGGKTGFAISVPDPELQQAGWLGVLEREGKPVMLALRLKLQDGRITEAEHLLVEPAQGRMDNVTTVRPGLLATIPEGQRLPHDELIRIGATYYDALDNNDGSLMPFAPDCARHENGMITAGEGAAPPPNANRNQNRAPVARDCKNQLDSQSFIYIDRIENRRMIAADPVTGLSMGLSHFRHPMTNLPYQVKHVDGSTSERNKENMPYEPFDMPAAHIFKIDAEGKVHEIEALGFTAPYNSPTGWE